MSCSTAGVLATSVIFDNSICPFAPLLATAQEMSQTIYTHFARQPMDTMLMCVSRRSIQVRRQETEVSELLAARCDPERLGKLV